MPLQINEHYKKFVQFAQQLPDADHSKVVITFDGHNITASETDEVHKLLRTDDEKLSNDETRRIFKQTILEMFGSEAHIPQHVKDAMALDDYNKGKPLTARRIMAVKKEVDRIIEGATNTNNAIIKNISNKELNKLPPEMQNGLAQLVDQLRGIFGTERVKPNAKITDLLSPTNISTRLTKLSKSASAQGRELTTAEVMGAFADIVYNRLAAITAGAHLLAKIKQHDPNFGFSEQSIGSQFDLRHPGFLNEIVNCKNSEEINNVFQRYDMEMNEFVNVTVRNNAYNKEVKAKASQKLAEALGLDVRLMAAHLDMSELCDKAKNLHTSIIQGDAPGCKEPGYNVEAAYDELIDKFVQERIEAYTAVDALTELSEEVKNRLKAEYIAYSYNLPIAPGVLLEIAKTIDVDKIVDALKAGRQMTEAVNMLHDVNKTLSNTICQMTGDQNFFQKAGMDVQVPLYGLILALVEEREPKLAQAIQNAGAQFFETAGEYCATNMESLMETVAFVKSLSIRGGEAETPSITNERNFYSAVEAETEAALNERGITDDTLRNIVKNAMQQRTNAELALATDLKSLSDYIAAAKANTLKIADEYLRAQQVANP